MVSLLFLPSTTPLKNKTAFKKGNLLPGEKSKELVGNWNQRFLDTKVLISIVYSEREENKRGF